MLNDADKAYYRALQALKEKDYRAAAGFLKNAENQFAEKPEIRILSEATELLLAVKDEIYELENETIEIEEILINGQETEFRG
ncbi:MAG: hypothetical protein AB1746_06230 [Candidatus Zixiibacteriota bacterium]